MSDYRAYTVGTDGRFIGFEPLVCNNDDDAIARASSLLDGKDIELWDGARFVIRLHHKPKSAPESRSPGT